MEHFIARYRPFVTAVLSGFDRLVFRGTMLPLVIQGGMFTLSDSCGSATARFQKVCRFGPVELALLFGRAFNQSPPYWLNLQADYDLKTAEASIGPRLRAIHSLTHA